MTAPSGDRTPGGGLETIAVGAVGDDAREHALFQRFWLLVVAGPDTGATFTSTGERTVIGTYDTADLVLHDSTVSRFHCEIGTVSGRLALRDLGSLNGTSVNGVAVREAVLATGATITVGRTQIRFDVGNEQLRLPVSERQRFGLLVGRSSAMRRVFAVLERAAAGDASVLVEGEPGTGKEAAAESIHRESARRDGGFLTVDCSAAPADVIEGRLFGNERGGPGAFEAAGGGTVFLEEIGELPLELQPKLLRVLERREVRRVGSTRYVPVDVRTIAASSRNLRAEVNAKRFRSDLYYRLASVAVRLPPLREHLDDLGLLVEQFAGAANADLAAALAEQRWPGNVRELREHLERALAPPDATPVGDGEPRVDPAETLRAGKDAWVRAQERRYLANVRARHGGDLAAAARAAGLDLVHFERLLARYGLR